MTVCLAQSAPRWCQCGCLHCLRWPWHTVIPWSRHMITWTTWRLPQYRVSTPRLNSPLHPYLWRLNYSTASPYQKVFMLNIMPRIAIIVSLASAAFAANCGNGPYAPCVSVYRGTGCQSFNLQTSYRPTCEGNCYVFPVSLKMQYFYYSLLICNSSIPCRLMAALLRMLTASRILTPAVSSQKLSIYCKTNKQRPKSDRRHGQC